MINLLTIYMYVLYTYSYNAVKHYGPEHLMSL